MSNRINITFYDRKNPTKKESTKPEDPLPVEKDITWVRKTVKKDYQYLSIEVFSVNGTRQMIEKSQWIQHLCDASLDNDSCQFFLTNLAKEFATIDTMYQEIPDHFKRVRLLFHTFPCLMSFNDVADTLENSSENEIQCFLREIRAVECSIFRMLSGLHSELNDGNTELMIDSFRTAMNLFRDVIKYKFLSKRNYCVEAIIAITCLQGIALCIAKLGQEAQSGTTSSSKSPIARSIWDTALQVRKTLIRLSPGLYPKGLGKLDYTFGAQDFEVTTTELVLFAGHAGARMRLVERCMIELDWLPNTNNPSLLSLAAAICYGIETNEEVLKKFGRQDYRKDPNDFWENLRKHFDYESLRINRLIGC